MSDIQQILEAIAASEARTHERIDMVVAKVQHAIQQERESNIRQDVELEHLKGRRRSITPQPGQSPVANAAQTGAIAGALIAIAEAYRHFTGK